MELLHGFLKAAILRDKVNTGLTKAIADARYQKAIYTGLDQDYILHEYRKRETKPQKEQRSRITATRTKHTTRKIENVINQLEVMEKPSIKILHNDEKVVNALDVFIERNNISKLAFDYVKYYNITDSNAFVICGLNELEEVEYNTVSVNNIYDYKVSNKNLKYVVFKNTRKTKTVEVHDFSLYHGSGIIKYVNTKDRTIGENETTVIGQHTYIVTTIDTPFIMAFRLGYIEDMTNNQETCVSIIDSASELFKALIWQGSELDVIDAAHGIVKQYAYVPNCGFKTKEANCVGGFMFANGGITTETCPKCKGSGFNIHTTSQDIITMPMPKDTTNIPDLASLTHTVYIDDGILRYKQEYIKHLNDEIMTTVFNTSVATKSEIKETAFAKNVDLQGIYATLNQVGEQVSNCFKWMVKCGAYLLTEKIDIEVIHGYKLELKLETVETLVAKKGRALENNAPVEVIKAIDLAILQKQHLDNPVTFNRYTIWEGYRPFADQSPTQVRETLARLPDTFRDKVLYTFFGKVRKNIELENDEKFYNGTEEYRRGLINAEVDKIIEELKTFDTSGRMNFDG